MLPLFCFPVQFVKIANAVTLLLLTLAQFTTLVVKQKLLFCFFFKQISARCCSKGFIKGFASTPSLQVKHDDDKNEISVVALSTKKCLHDFAVIEKEKVKLTESERDHDTHLCLIILFFCHCYL